MKMVLFKIFFSGVSQPGSFETAADRSFQEWGRKSHPHCFEGIYEKIGCSVFSKKVVAKYSVTLSSLISVLGKGFLFKLKGRIRLRNGFFNRLFFALCDSLGS
jgi:hypothetical protein